MRFGVMLAAAAAVAVPVGVVAKSDVSPMIAKALADPARADRASDHVTLLGSRGRARQSHLPQSHRLGRDQDAFRIHAVQNVFEAAAFLAEAIVKRNFKVLDEEFVGIDGLAAHLFDFMHDDAAAVEVGIK